MSDPYFQKLFSDRIGGENYGKSTEIYKFEKIKRAKRQAIENYPDRKLLDFGIGENDAMAAPVVREKLAEAINKPECRGYADNGILEFKEAAARFMQREFGVQLDPATQINHCIGSKSALAIVPACFINPGDVTLMTTPGYPVAGTHTSYYGGEVHNLPLLAENNFLPDLDSIPADILKRAKLLVLNYPNSPTGALAPASFFEKVVAFAKANNIVVLHDGAHIMFNYQGKPTSFLETPGAMDVGIETHSLSKGWNMIGWRLGWVCGNAKLVQAFSDVKDNCDSGQCIAIQHAGVEALDNEKIPQETSAKYKRRLEKLVTTLQECGVECEMPGGTYFLYIKNPVGTTDGSITFANAEEASQYLITEKSICTVPWDNAGAFLRFSVTYVAETEADEDALMAEMKERLAGVLKF